jgi:hypothetical protein
MNQFLRTFACVALFAATMLAGVDGKYVAERKMERDGQSFTIIQTFDIKADGSKLTGKVTMQFGDMEPRTVDLTDGKVEGSKVSFTTTMEGPNGAMKMSYKGTVDGDTLKGESIREGGEGRPFEAKRK